MAGRTRAALHLNYPVGLRGTSLAAKVVYTRMLSDDALNHAGVLPLRPALWADECEMSEGDIDKALRELEDKRYAYTDYKTHQVLVRTFIRNDGVADIPNVLHSACRAALNLRSEKLRRVLAQELRKLAPQPPDKINEKTNKRYVYPDPHGTADKIDPGPPEGGEGSHGSHAASHRIPSQPMASDAGSPGGGGGGGGSSSGFVDGLFGADAAAAPSKVDARAIVGAWTAAVTATGTVKPQAAMKAQVGREARQLLADGTDPGLVLRAAQSCGSKGFPTLHREVMQMQRNVRPLRPTGPRGPNYNLDGSPRRDPKSGAWMEI